jgi:two-component system, chemotaxis family, chemotaxis protein CheY
MLMTEVNCLIVDDSRMSRMIVKRIIASTHPEWKIEEAGDGQEALDKASEKDFELIFLDYNMPIMNGGEVAEILRPRFPEAKIAFLTANVQEAIKNKAIDLHIDFIPKPITEAKIKKYVG